MARSSLKLNKEKTIQIVYAWILFVLLLCSTTILTAPIITYIVQIWGILLCLILRFIFYHRINLKVFLFMVSLVFGVELLALYQFSYLQYTEIFWLNTHRTVFWFVCATLCYDFFCKIEPNYFSKVVSWIIVLLSLSVFIQVISYHVFSFELDYAILLDGESSRSGYTILYELIYRPTGLTSEPSIHSGIMTALLCVQYLLNRKINMVCVLGLFSILLTFSILGILMAFILLSIIYMKNIYSFIVGMGFLVLVSVFFENLLSERWNSFMIGDDGSNNVKIEVYNKFITDSNALLSGFGFVGKSRTAPLFYDAMYDMSLYFNIFIYWGVILGLLALFFIAKCILINNFDWREKILILLAFIKLSGPTLIFFNFFVVILFAINRQRTMRCGIM